MNKHPRPKICIVSPFCYPLFNPEERQAHFGGWEVRTYVIAKELARQGHFDVSMIVWDHGQPHIEHREGVTIYSWLGKPNPHRDPEDSPSAASAQTVNESLQTPLDDHSPNNVVTPVKPADLNAWLAAHTRRRGRLVLRTLYLSGRAAAGALLQGAREAAIALRNGAQHVFWLLREPFGFIGERIILKRDVAIYDEVDADLYMMPGNNYTAGELAYYCKVRRKKYVFLAGSDMDYDPAYQADFAKMGLYSVPNYLRVYAIENATAHIAQNEYQATILKEAYGRTCIIVRNPIDLTLFFPRNLNAQAILWVGNSDDRVRRPSLILELAHRLPEYPFVVVMSPLIPETDRACWARARELPNVTMIGRTPFKEVERYFANAKLFVNTSVFEGFPNTFLQAAKYGVPFVALKVDPGKVLSEHGCGVSCGDDMEQLYQNTRLFMTDAAVYARASEACLRYVRTFHDKDKIIPQYENVFCSLLASV